MPELKLLRRENSLLSLRMETSLPRASPTLVAAAVLLLLDGRCIEGLSRLPDNAVRFKIDLFTFWALYGLKFELGVPCQLKQRRCSVQGKAVRALSAQLNSRGLDR